MDATREIYWNVGRGAAAPMLLLTALALAVSALGWRRRNRIWRLGRAMDRTDALPSRIAAMVRGALGQGAVVRARGAGVPHALFFWALLVLLAGTVLVMVQADLVGPLLGRTFLRGPFYLAFSLALDVAGLAALAMLAALAARRLLLRRPSTREDWAVHALLAAVLVTGFLVEGARIAATELGAPSLARHSPAGLAAARALAGMGEASLRGAHRALWWGHLSLVLGLVAALPWTKLRHLLTTPLGLLFADRRPRGSLPPLDLDSGAETFGASRVAELGWKDLFDADACTGCARCEERCPAHGTGKPLSPLRLVREIGAAAALNPSTDLVEAARRDAIWSCTTCFACQDACPASVEHVGKVIELRRNLALMRGEFPGEEVRTAAGHVEVSGNPFGFAPAARGEWADGLGLPVLSEGARADVLYFAGCYASFDRRNREVARSFVRVCRAAGVSVGILGKAEWCCGEPVRRLGNEYLYREAALRVIQAIHASGATKVVTTCAHCFGSLDRDYRDLGFTPQVEHHATFIAGLVAGGRLRLDGGELDCTFHDSCQLARCHGVVEAPRAVLRAAGARVTEMDRAGRDGFCCGGGGGRILAEERVGVRIAAARAHMARATGAAVLVSSCPFCLAMLEDGVKTGGHEGQLVTRDLAEVVAGRIAAGGRT
jgi:Fe-S oxidoreductase/nitrate reductase gamma subunit